MTTRLTSLALSLTSVAALATCGDNNTAPDHGMSPDSGVGAGAPCVATFSDNFAEHWTGPDCATLDAPLDTPSGGTTLHLMIPSKTIGTQFAIAIDLGATPAPGTYTSQTLPDTWSASALQEFDMTSCLYDAGTGSVPAGTFTLTLDSIGDAAHGTLDLVLYVLARPYTYCGEANTEHVVVKF